MVLLASLLAVLLLALVAVSIRHLLDACGLVLPAAFGIVTGCAAGDVDYDPGLEAAMARRSLLEARVSALETRLARMRCLPPAPVPAPPPDPKLEHWADRDIRVLDGCWELVSNYRLQTHHDSFGGYRQVQVRAWEMCFDSGGVGNQTLRLGNGESCSGRARGRFTDASKVRVRDDVGGGPGVPCSDGGHIHERSADCELQADGHLMCAFNQAYGGPTGVRVRFRQKQR